MPHSRKKDIQKIGNLRDCPKRVFVTCPSCGEYRPLTLENIKREGFTGRCVQCRELPDWNRDRSPLWRGGRSKDHVGYVRVLLEPDDPYYSMTNQRGYVLEHRLVMARHLGRLLRDDEIVHHINGRRDDNRIENLELLSVSEHMSLHNRNNKPGHLGYVVSSEWRGGVGKPDFDDDLVCGRTMCDGYVMIKLKREHPYYCMTHRKGYVAEHRLIVAMVLGRPLRDDERVHHKNGIRTDNRLENLELLEREPDRGLGARLKKWVTGKEDND